MCIMRENTPSDSSKTSDLPTRRDILKIAGLALIDPIASVKTADMPFNTPSVYWVAQPSRPDETVMIVGANLGNVRKVKVALLRDKPFAPPSIRVNSEPVPDSLPWKEVSPLQKSDICVKFVIPKDLGYGVYLCQLVSGKQPVSTIRINAPDIWWIQGDEGRTATSGGRLRIFGRCMAIPSLHSSTSVRVDTEPYPPSDYPIQPKHPKQSASMVCLRGADGRNRYIKARSHDPWSISCDLSKELEPGSYSVMVHNGRGGEFGWVPAGSIEVKTRQAANKNVYSVMDYYGANAKQEMLSTLPKGSISVDRTDAVSSALKKAQAYGGGIVFFPAGVYTLRAPLNIPPNTILKGEGMGLVTLWWGTGNMALDGGSNRRRLTAEDKNNPPVMISGDRYGIEDLTLIMPRMYQTGVVTGNGFRMRRVRVLVDRYWIRSGEREEGLLLQLGDNCQVTDCDIVARGVAMISGAGMVIARNRITAGKSNLDLAHSDGVIVEDNVMISMDPTAYINLSGEGRNVYYSRNRHEAFYAQQSDFSWTFDGVAQAYLGRVASAHGVDIELGDDPQYPDWAKENSPLWRRSVVCILGGKGEGQYRYVVENRGRSWKVDMPFSIPPDSSSVINIIPYRGNVMLIGNRFEDAGWVNLGYGSSFNVIGANNQTFRVGEMLNLGLRNTDGVMPSWYVQYHDNDIREGDTMVQSVGDMRNSQLFSSSVTRFCLHRGQHIHDDNWGGIGITGNAEDIIVENCTLDNSNGAIRVDAETKGVLVRRNHLKSAS